MIKNKNSAFKKTLGQDSQGRYFRNLGWLKRNSKYSQKKFYLGHDEDPAYLAAARLQALWNRIAENHQRAVEIIQSGIVTSEIPDINFDILEIKSENGYPEIRQRVGRPVWTELTLAIAEAIRQGEPVAKIPIETVQNQPEFDECHITEASLAPWLDNLRQQYPVIHIELQDQALSQSVDAMLKAKGQKQLADGQRLTAEPPTNQRSHHAIDAYQKAIRTEMVDEDGESTEWSKTKIRQIQFVKNHTCDLDLGQLGGPSIDSILQTLAKRPFTQKGKPCSKSFAQSVIKEFRKFLQWLDTCGMYAWDWPKAFEFKSPTVAKQVSADVFTNPSRQRKLKTYNVSELTTLYDYATPIQRMYFLLGLNCGFANAEMTTLLLDDVFLLLEHLKLPCSSRNTDSIPNLIGPCKRSISIFGIWVPRWIIFSNRVAEESPEFHSDVPILPSS